MVVGWRGCGRALPLTLGKPGTAGSCRPGLLQVPSTARLQDTGSSVLTLELCALSEGWSRLLLGYRGASGACSPWCQRHAALESRDSPCPEGCHGGSCRCFGMQGGVVVENQPRCVRGVAMESCPC